MNHIHGDTMMVLHCHYHQSRRITRRRTIDKPVKRALFSLCNHCTPKNHVRIEMPARITFMIMGIHVVGGLDSSALMVSFCDVFGCP